MKNLNKTLLLLFFTLSAFFISAQSVNSNKITKKYSSVDWLSMMRDGSVNIHDVQKAFYKWYRATHKEDKDKEQTKAGGEDEDGAYSFFKRWEWYNLPRADKNGNRPDPYKLSSEYSSYLKNNSGHSLHRAIHNAAGLGNWSYAGNTTVPTNSNSGFGGDGRVNRVRVMPGNTNIMYACAASGGLWKTTNGGTSWSTNTDQLGDLTTSDIAINPLKTNVMYLATGDADGIQAIYTTPGTIGILKSYDGGATWDTTGLAYSMSQAGANSYAVSELLIDPNDTSILIAATTFGIWRSSNSGYSWQMEQSGWFHSIEFEPGHPSIVYAAASNLFNGGAAFYRSTNNGISWTQVNTGLPPGTDAEGFEIGVSAADSNDVYILADSVGTYGFEGLYRSTNHGVSFSTMALFSWNGVPNVLGWDPNGGDVDGQGWYTLSMAVSQTNADSLWVGGVNVWGSTDGGVTWNLSSNWEGSPYVHADIHGIQFMPGNSKKYIVGCDGGVFITSNAGSTWTDISNNLEIGQQYSIGSEANNAGKWITGWQDNGTNFSNTPWAQVMGGDGMDCFIDWSNNNNMYAETGEGGLSKSTNAGNTWNNCVNGITENGPWVTVWLQDPRTSTTLYSGFNNVWKSTNSGGHWSPISTWGGGGSISAIAVDSANPNYIYAAQSSRIELTTNGGTSWTNITGTLPVGSTSISGIAVDSKQPSHVWITFAGYSSGNEVFESVNSGHTWTNISTGLPNLPVNCIVSESGSPEAIYIGTDQGVYYHDTLSNTWTFYNSGLPMVMIGDLTIYQPGKELLAATYGRGTWETPLYSATPPVANFEGVSTSVCAGNTVLFTDTSSNNPTSWKWTFTGGIPATSTSQSQSVLYSTPGTYPVKLVVSNQYGSDSLTKNAYITVNAEPAVSASVNARILCHGQADGSATATPAGGASPYTYSWTGGGINATKTGMSAGTYTVTVTDKNGCTGTASITLTQPAAAITFTKDSTSVDSTNGVCNGGASINVSGGIAPYTYNWSPGGGTNDSISGKCPGQYCCTIMDNNGCSETTCITIGNITGIANIYDASDIHIYPNPNKGMFTIQWSVVNSQWSVEVYDVLGQNIYTQSNIRNSTFKINISDKADGLYLIRILNRDGTLVTQRKVMKVQ